MSEEQIKFIKTFLKQVHGYTENQISSFFASDDSTKEAITSAKAVMTENYEEGVGDGLTQAKKTIVESLKGELGIKIALKDVTELEKVGVVIKPLVEGKYNADKVSETEKVKEWRDKYEALEEEKNLEIEKVRNESSKQVNDLRRLSFAQEILKREGYAIPEDSNAYQTKLDMVISMLDKKGYVYNMDKNDGKDYRVRAEDGTPIKNGGKLVTYEDDFKSLADIAFGRNPANSKESGFSKEDSGAGTGGAGTERKSFDWSEFKSKGVQLPSTKEEARKIQNDPTLELGDRKLASQYINYLEVAETATA